MGHFKYKDSSSEDEKEDEDDNGKGIEEEKEQKKKKTEDKEVIEKRKRTTSSGGESVVKEEEIQFGEQLQDDLINSFCDKLQAVCPDKPEGFLAIQFLLITEMADVQKHITGKKSAFQVLYDRTRSHYLLVHQNPVSGYVEIYDSLQTFDKNGDPYIIPEISTHIVHLFGHLHEETIPVMVDKDYEQQVDNFSCGYRVIGALVHLTRGEHPGCYRYGRTYCLEFLKKILKEPAPTWQMFKSAKFGKPKATSGENRKMCYIVNTSFAQSTTSSNRRTRTSSTDSLASNLSHNSQPSKKSRNSSSQRSKSPEITRKPKRRADAGHNEYQEENEITEKVVQYSFKSSDHFETSPTSSKYPFQTISDGTLMEYFRNSYHLLGGLFRRNKLEDDEKKIEK